MGIRNGGFTAAAPITDRTGIGPGALGPDAERAARIEMSQRAASRADGMDVDDRDADRQASYRGVLGQTDLIIDE